MSACIEDARNAALDPDKGPAEPAGFNVLRQRLAAARGKLPPLYEQAVAQPYIKTLNKLGPQGFDEILKRDPNRECEAGLLMDIAQAILQHGEAFEDTATDGFQEVASDLYDGFLSAEDRQGVKPPDLGVIPPLVKWGNPDSGPYTWPVNATDSFGVQAGVVNLPPANARAGLFAWTAVGHETAGHDILNADKGLPRELANSLRAALASLGHGLAQYWSDRIDETASDLLGILNMGPAAGIGLLVYFRGLNAAWGEGPKLRSDGPAGDPHPADIIRGYLAAETVALLSFTGHTAWADTIAAETDKDVDTIRLAGETISPALARKSAKVVAETLVGYKAEALERHALGEIQDWRDRDEENVQTVRNVLRSGGELPAAQPYEIYAAHAVAAAATEALADPAGLAQVFDRMKTILKAMHDKNPSWGPLFVRHPGDLARRFVFPRG
jgi:hypothetical protein